MFRKLSKKTNSVEPMCMFDTCPLDCAFGEGCQIIDFPCIIDRGEDPNCQVFDL